MRSRNNSCRRSKAKVMELKAKTELRVARDSSVKAEGVPVCG